MNDHSYTPITPTLEELLEKNATNGNKEVSIYCYDKFYTATLEWRESQEQHKITAQFITLPLLTLWLAEKLK